MFRYCRDDQLHCLSDYINVSCANCVSLN